MRMDKIDENDTVLKAKNKTYSSISNKTANLYRNPKYFNEA